MKPKQLTLVVVLALVLGGLGWWIRGRNQAAYLTAGAGQGRKVLEKFPLNDVARLVIREGTNVLALAKDQDVWKVRERFNYPANFSEVGDLIRKMWELKAVQSETVGESELGRLQLLEPDKGTNGGTRLDFLDASDKLLASVLLGKKHMRRTETPSPMGGSEGWPDGRWILALNGPKQAVLVSETFTEVEAKADRWLNKDFFKVEKLKSAEVTHPEATNSWKIYREKENGELNLADAGEGEKLDTGKASPVGNALSWPSFVDVLSPEAKPEETGLDRPVSAKVETFDGFTYTIKIGKKLGTEENYGMQVTVAADLPKERPAGTDEKPEDKEKLDKEFKEKMGKLEDKLKQEKAYAGWTYSVSKWTLEPLLKGRREYLQEEKKEEAKPPTPPEPVPPAAADSDEEEDSAAK